MFHQNIEDRGKTFIFLSVHSDSTGLKLHQSQSTEAEKNPPAVTSLGVPQEHSQLISLLTSSHPSQQTLDRLTTKHARAQRHQLSCSPRQQVQLLHHRRTLLMETLVVLLHSRFAGSPVGRRGGQHPGQTSVSTAAFCPHQPPVGNTWGPLFHRKAPFPLFLCSCPLCSPPRAEHLALPVLFTLGPCTVWAAEQTLRVVNAESPVLGWWGQL